MKQYIPNYTKDCVFEKHLNTALMTKSADLPLVEFVKESWRSLEVIPNIKIVGFEYTEEESDIEINKHIFKREKKKRKNERFDYKYVDDDRYGKLTTKIHVTVREKNPDTGEMFEHVYPSTKAMFVYKRQKVLLDLSDGGKKYLYFFTVRGVKVPEPWHWGLKTSLIDGDVY